MYKGPLALYGHAYSLKIQVESENDIGELKSIGVVRFATEDWRMYHESKIISSKDNFGRVMMSYSSDGTNNMILSVNDVQEFVKDNDAQILSNVQLKKVNTVIVPISLSRLQATVGLISVGSIVDIYSVDKNESYYDSGDTSVESGSSSGTDEVNVESNNSTTNLMFHLKFLLQLMILTWTPKIQWWEIMNGGTDSDDELNAEDGSKVNGVTVLAILRSKDRGVVDSPFTISSLKIHGNSSISSENTKTISTDVEELLKASALGSSGGSDALDNYLNSYGVKLSDYGRMSNLGDLDSEYILLEVPRSDVDFVINNIDSLI